ncbi:MAG: hypothetical protein ACI97K_002155 [Glaciecola sp.]|jgi:hypothetical protein
MKTNDRIPPKLGLILLETCLPNSVKDEIIGDLHEQYYESNDRHMIKQFSFWWQAALIISRYVMMNKKTIALILSAVSLAIFLIFTAAILFLSNSDDATAFSKPYWTNGDFYQFFLDPMLYSYISGEMFAGITPQLFINIPSILWSLAGVGLIIILKKTSKLNLQTIAIASLLLLVGPYIWGMLNFKANEIPLRESGPILAFTLISVLYLVLPLTALFIKEMFRKTKLA